MRYIDADKLIEFIEKRGAGLGVTVANCCNFKDIINMTPTEDVVPRSEVEEWYAEYHKVKEDLKQEKMYHKATEKLADRYLIELSQAKQEVARLQSILLQFTDIVHKWGNKNGIDTTEISLVPILEQEADSIVEKAKQEVAREIFEEVAEVFKRHENYCKYDICELLYQDLATGICELRKKYIGE